MPHTYLTLIVLFLLACGGATQFDQSTIIAHPGAGAPPAVRFHQVVPTDVVSLDAINGDFFTEVSLEQAKQAEICFEIRERMPMSAWLAQEFRLASAPDAQATTEVLLERTMARRPPARQLVAGGRERVCTASRRDGSCSHYLTRPQTRPTTTAQLVQRKSRVCFAREGLLEAGSAEIVLELGPMFPARYRWQLGIPCDGTTASCACSRHEGEVEGTCTQMIPAAPQTRSKEQVCNEWRHAQAAGPPAPATNQCNAPSVPAAVVESVLRRTNTYRWLAGLPPVRFAGQNPDWQSCAMILDASGVLDHFPPPSRTCFTPGGRAASETSNISIGFRTPADAIDGLMEDLGAENQRTLGHRRWFLSPVLGEIFIGAAGRGGCFSVRDESGIGPEWSAYPNPGFTPMGIARQDAYSFHASHPLGQVSVSMRAGGRDLPVQQYALPDGLGRQQGVAWHHVGWQPEPNVEVQVEIRTARQTYRYSFTPVGC